MSWFRKAIELIEKSVYHHGSSRSLVRGRPQATRHGGITADRREGLTMFIAPLVWIVLAQVPMIRSRARSSGPGASRSSGPS